MNETKDQYEQRFVIDLRDNKVLEDKVYRNGVLIKDYVKEEDAEG